MFVRAAALHKKTQGRIGGKNISRAKAQRREENLRKRGSALRLCARNILGKKHSLCKALHRCACKSNKTSTVFWSKGLFGNKSRAFSHE